MNEITINECFGGIVALLIITLVILFLVVYLVSHNEKKEYEEIKNKRLSEKEELNKRIKRLEEMTLDNNDLLSYIYYGDEEEKKRIKERKYY